MFIYEVDLDSRLSLFKKQVLHLHKCPTGHLTIVKAKRQFTWAELWDFVTVRLQQLPLLNGSNATSVPVMLSVLPEGRTGSAENA